MTNQVNQEALVENEFSKQYPYDDMDGWDRKLFKSGYQAATQASEIEINSLKEQMKELEADLELLKPHPICDMGCMLACNTEGNAIRELQADNNQLREALREITYSHDGYARKKAEQALATYDKLSKDKHDTNK